jgi:hypothetical protein
MRAAHCKQGAKGQASDEERVTRSLAAVGPPTRTPICGLTRMVEKGPDHSCAALRPATRVPACGLKGCGKAGSQTAGGNAFFSLTNVLMAHDIFSVVTSVATVLLAISFLPYPTSASGTDISGGDAAVFLEGTYSADSKLPVFSPALSSRGAFQVVLQKDSWIINYQDFLALTNPMVLYSAVDASCDGTSIYAVRTANPGIMTKGVISHTAQVYSGIYPPPSEFLTHQLWLAFASAGVLSNATGKTKPVVSTDLSVFYNKDFLWEYCWTTNEQYPRELVFRSPSHLFQRQMNQNGKLGFIDFGPPYQNGFKSAEAHWLQTTYIGGSYVPTKYEFIRFLTLVGATNAAQLDPLYKFQCSVTNASLAEAQSVPPDQHGLVLVSDHRFAERGYGTLTWFTTNQWLRAGDPELAQLVSRSAKTSMEAEALQQLGFSPASSWATVGRLILRATLGVLLVLPLIYFFAKGLFRKQQIETN